MTTTNIQTQAPRRALTLPVQGFKDTRKGPIPLPASALGKPPANVPKSLLEQRVDKLLAKFSAGKSKPDALQPDSLFTLTRSEKRQSLLVSFCQSLNAKAHAFLVETLLPVVDRLAQRIDADGPDQSIAAKDWKESAGKHLIAGADAALHAKNPRSLEALLTVAVKHFPEHVPTFVESRLLRNPRSIDTFAAAGIPREALAAIVSGQGPAAAQPARHAAPAAPAAAAREPAPRPGQEPAAAVPVAAAAMPPPAPEPAKG